MVDVLYQQTIDGENVGQDTCTYSMGINGKQVIKKYFIITSVLLSTNN